MLLLFYWELYEFDFICLSLTDKNDKVQKLGILDFSFCLVHVLQDHGILQLSQSSLNLNMEAWLMRFTVSNSVKALYYYNNFRKNENNIAKKNKNKKWSKASQTSSMRLR